jgi:hypothetical protein
MLRLTSILLAVLVGSVGCKTEPKKPTRTEKAAAELEAVRSPGYDLQDSRSLSASLVRVTSSADLKSATVGQAVLLSASDALAPGYSCTAAEVWLNFQLQGEDQLVSPAKLRSEPRKVVGCKSVREILAEKKKAATVASPMLKALESALATVPEFDIAKLSFEGGVPASGLKWQGITALGSALTVETPEASLKTWGDLSEKFVALAGFNQDEALRGAPASRRVWLPFRVKAEAEGQGPFVFDLESWFSEAARSPIKSMPDWLKGPQLYFHSPMVFSGVSRFANLNPFSEIQTPDPRLLCFVVKWTEKKEAPEALRFAPRCLDAAPVLALVR